MTEELNDHYWSTRYTNKTHRWDLGKVSNPIKTYIDQLEDKNLKILVPGSGNSYEAIYLLEQGFTAVTCIDISEVLIENLKLKHQNYITRGVFSLIHTDFFELTDTYDLIIEQTFFCALKPSLRENYCAQMSKLLSEKGKLVGLMFNRDFEGGPPFGGNKHSYEALFSSYFRKVSIESCQNSEPERMGSEVWINVSQ